MKKVKVSRKTFWFHLWNKILSITNLLRRLDCHHKAVLRRKDLLRHHRPLKTSKFEKRLKTFCFYRKKNEPFAHLRLDRNHRFDRLPPEFDLPSRNVRCAFAANVREIVIHRNTMVSHVLELFRIDLSEVAVNSGETNRKTDNFVASTVKNEVFLNRTDNF